MSAWNGSVQQRWSPREHIFMTLASKPQVLENCSVLGSRTALFFEWLKFCRSAEKCFSRLFFGDRRKIFFKDFFLRKTLAFVSLVLGLGLEHSCPWPSPRIFFLCPRPWPRALCPRLHQWHTEYRRSAQEREKKCTE